MCGDAGVTKASTLRLAFFVDDERGAGGGWGPGRGNGLERVNLAHVVAFKQEPVERSASEPTRLTCAVPEGLARGRDCN